jgi:hypothetical protein
MTAQIPDTFLLDGEQYDLVGSGTEGLFDPEASGLRPSGLCTGCWRGYVCRYGLDGDDLVLDRLELTQTSLDGEEPEWPAIGGVTPVEVGEGSLLYGHLYAGVGLPVAYTGEMLLAREFIPNLYMHMGFQPAWRYRHVIELQFKDGRLTGRRDLSDVMAKMRESGLAEPPGAIGPFGIG